MLNPGDPFDLEGAKNRLARDGGGHQVVHTSPGIEVDLYVLVAPEPDRQQPHEEDELYIVLAGSGVLDLQGKRIDVRPGQAVFVPAGARHHFRDYEQLSVLIVLDRRPR
jgi:mannose-6-phosphate isomerase-like protein (cupin superfamily)